MPFVRIDLARGKPPEFLTTLGDIVYRAMVETISVPENDKYVVIHEHEPAQMYVTESYLGMKYAKDIVFITRVGIAKDDVSFGNGEAQYAA